MDDKDRTVGALIKELGVLRQKIAELAKSDVESSKVEELNRDYKESFRVATEDSTDFILMVTGNGSIDYITDSVEKSLGYKTEELIGKDAFEFVHPDDRRHVMDDFNCLTRHLCVRKIPVVRISHKDSSEHIFEGMAQNFLDNPSLRAIVINCRDITAYKKAEKELQENEEKYHQLFATVSDAIIVFDADTKTFLDVNEAAEKLYGYTREEFLRLRQKDITAEPDKSDYSIRKTLNEGLERIPLRYHKKKDGMVFPVEIAAGKFILKGHKVICVVVRDITERIKAEEALKTYASKLESQRVALEQKNIALQEIIAQIEVEKNKTKENVLANISEFILPTLKKLRIKGESTRYITLVERQLEQLTSSFGARITQRDKRLTPREIEISNMIKEGFTSKEISSLLNVSCQTIEKHRKNIRKKLGISHKKTNLTSLLKKL